MANPLLMAEIFDNINEGIYILNRKGDYIYCNNAFLKMVGATREEALSLNAFQLIPEGQVSVSVAVTAFTEKKKVSVVNNVLTPKGYHYRQLATATPIFGSGGEVEYMLVETVRLDLLAKRYQQAILYEDDSTIEVPALSPERARAKETIIADSPAMQAILQTAAQVAQTDSTVLISGETGTGKEVLAKYIHRNSSRADAPIIEINCAALPENLLEAELFGYTKGAFTGALNTGKPGLIEAAHGGTLFLDEINSLPLALQGKFLRVLESHKSKRLGAVEEQEIDFRLLAATNQNLKEGVLAGTFRADLYYRLNVIPLELPPLRERREDIIPLINHFLMVENQKYHTNKSIYSDTIDAFEGYCWPGNGKEIENLCKYFYCVKSDRKLTERDLPPYILSQIRENEEHLSPLERQVLIALSQNPKKGRAALLRIVREQGVDVTEGKIRRLLQDLSDRGLVRTNRTKGGCEITGKGETFL